MAPRDVMRILPRFLCRLIGHRRSARHAYVDAEEGRWRSFCRHCGAPLRKGWPLGWEEV
jgi:hypothetical protein